MNTSCVPVPGLGPRPCSHPWNAPPLLPNPMAKLPLGGIKPEGWLRHQLGLMADGMTGRLTELSSFLRDDNGWFGTANEGWEEQAYWLRGFHDLAVLTGEQRLLAEAGRWIEAVLSSQDTDGYFGAVVHKHIDGKGGRRTCDLWPHMVMLDAVIHHFEHTGDERVIPFMRRFFEFCQALPDAEVMQGDRSVFGNWKVHVQVARAGDMLPHIYWLYNHTRDPWLLELGSQFYRSAKPNDDEWLDRHIVNFTQRFAYPGVYYAQSREPWHLEQTEYWYRQHLDTWGQQPRGIFGADERVRPGDGKVDPRQGFETCGFVEFAKNFFQLGRLTGRPVYADRCEDIMLNHFPASQTPDLKGLHYLTAANLPQLDSTSGHDFYNELGERSNPQLPYSPHRFRCCQHNVAMGWPWYAQNLWQATADGGLAAWLYGASTVTAEVGPAGAEVAVVSETDYPFGNDVAMTLRTETPVAFPLYLRVPRWCAGMTVKVNGEQVQVDASPGAYVRVDSRWTDGDAVEIHLPMRLSLTEWPRTGSVTLERGPLSYSVRIEEEWRRCGGTDEWPEWEVIPKSPWNYGLVIDRGAPHESVEVVEKGRTGDQPWTVEAAPVELKARAKRIPAWSLGDNQMVPELNVSPIRSDEPVDEIRLVPLGCARLRMACLPVIGEGPDAQPWSNDVKNRRCY